MGERRLIEITSTINGMEGPLETMAYVSSLNSSDVYLLLQYLKSSKYRGMNFFNGLRTFAEDYLRGKNLLIEKLEVEPEVEDLTASRVYAR